MGAGGHDERRHRLGDDDQRPHHPEHDLADLRPVLRRSAPSRQATASRRPATRIDVVAGTGIVANANDVAVLRTDANGRVPTQVRRDLRGRCGHDATTSTTT